MKNVSFAAPANNPSGPRVLFPRNTISTVQSVMKRNLQPNASNATRSSPKEALLIEMNLGIESALPVRIVRNLWQVKGSPHATTSHFVPIALVNCSAKDAQLVANPSQEKVAWEVQNLWLLKLYHGTMTVSSATFANVQWLARDLSRMEST